MSSGGPLAEYRDGVALQLNEKDLELSRVASELDLERTTLAEYRDGVALQLNEKDLVLSRVVAELERQSRALEECRRELAAEEKFAEATHARVLRDRSVRSAVAEGVSRPLETSGASALPVSSDAARVDVSLSEQAPSRVLGECAESSFPERGSLLAELAASRDSEAELRCELDRLCLEPERHREMDFFDVLGADAELGELSE